MDTQSLHPTNPFTLPASVSLQTFRNDLKEVLKRAGVEGKPVLLFIEDYQIVDPAFLEYINSLLSGGEVSRGSLAGNAFAFAAFYLFCCCRALRCARGMSQWENGRCIRECRIRGRGGALNKQRYKLA